MRYHADDRSARWKASKAVENCAAMAYGMTQGNRLLDKKGARKFTTKVWNCAPEVEADLLRWLKHPRYDKCPQPRVTSQSAAHTLAPKLAKLEICRVVLAQHTDWQVPDELSLPATFYEEYERIVGADDAPTEQDGSPAPTVMSEDGAAAMEGCDATGCASQDDTNDDEDDDVDDDDDVVVT